MKQIANKYKILGLSLLSFLVVSSYGADDLSTIASTLTGQFESFGKLITAVAYLAGFGMVVSAIFKFKQHKDNPQQVPMGTPITILLVGVSLIFMPSIIKPVGSSIFGDNQTMGGFTGEGVSSVSGSSSSN